MPLATLRTTLLPPIALDVSQGGGEPSVLVKLLRPAVDTPFGTYAPEGDPGEGTWPWGAVLLVGLLGAAVVLLMRAGARVRW